METFSIKTKLLNRLKGIQISLERRHSDFLVNLEQELVFELEEILLQEEKFWHQKASRNWVKFGDKNSRYFHNSIILRRRANWINGIFFSNGAWCTEEHNLGRKLLYFFSSSILRRSLLHRALILRGIFRVLRSMTKDGLSVMLLITKSEKLFLT